MSMLLRSIGIPDSFYLRALGDRLVGFATPIPAIPVVQSPAIHRDFTALSFSLPLSAVHYQDEDIFGAAILIFKSTPVIRVPTGARQEGTNEPAGAPRPISFPSSEANRRSLTPLLPNILLPFTPLFSPFSSLLSLKPRSFPSTKVSTD